MSAIYFCDWRIGVLALGWFVLGLKFGWSFGHKKHDFTDDTENYDLKQ